MAHPTSLQDLFAPPETSTPSISAIALEQLKRELLRSTPFVNFEYVTVTFGSANTDADIRHTLRPASPEDVRYIVVSADRAADLYHDQSGTRKPWGDGYIILRSNIAGLVATLLLFIPR